MSIWRKAKAAWDGLLGRAEELYGETHGDAAAEVRGEAHVAESEAEEEAEEESEKGAPRRRAGSEPRDDDATPAS